MQLSTSPTHKGAHFHLSDTHDQTVYHCKLSNDHKQLIISNDHFPINMKHILEVKTISAEEPGEYPVGTAVGLVSEWVVGTVVGASE